MLVVRWVRRVLWLLDCKGRVVLSGGIEGGRIGVLAVSWAWSFGLLWKS